MVWGWTVDISFPRYFKFTNWFLKQTELYLFHYTPYFSLGWHQWARESTTFACTSIFFNVYVASDVRGCVNILHSCASKSLTIALSRTCVVDCYTCDSLVTVYYIFVPRAWILASAKNSIWHVIVNGLVRNWLLILNIYGVCIPQAVLVGKQFATALCFSCLVYTSGLHYSQIWDCFSL